MDTATKSSDDFDRYIEKLKECKPLTVPELEKLFKKVLNLLIRQERSWPSRKTSLQ